MRSDGRPSTILLHVEGTIYEEAIAGGTILPGHLINKTNTDTVVVHASAAGQAPKFVATEEMLVLKGEGLDDDYGVGDRVSYRRLRSGDKVQMWLEDGHAVAIGDILESAGDGTLQPVTGNFGCFQAAEAVDTSGGAAAAARINVIAL
jgi:hypothetical protein